MKPLIIGVDPGSTSAVAAVDLDGEIQLLESGKNFPPRDIIQRVIKVGKPVVVASDKGKTPSNVEKIASSVGARLFEPEKDLSSDRKNELGKGANSHELDAVASAVNAQKQLQRDIQKIRKYDRQLEQPVEDIAEKIFKDEPVKEEEAEEEDVEEEDVEESTEEVGYDRGEADREKKRLETKIDNLEGQIQQLRSEIGEKEAKIEGLREKIQEMKEEDRQEVVENREIKKREAIIRDKDEEIEDLERQIEKFKIREAQYRKAIQKIFEKDHRPVPLVDEYVETVPEEAVTYDSEVLDKLEKRGAEIHHIEDIEGVELNNYIVVDELPDTEDFESVIEEYRRKR